MDFMPSGPQYTVCISTFFKFFFIFCFGYLYEVYAGIGSITFRILQCFCGPYLVPLVTPYLEPRYIYRLG